MFRHPKGFFLICWTEMWVRFSFYGMRAVLVLYIVANLSDGGLGWSARDALQLYGTYLGIAYITPLLGGWIADRFIGQCGAILLGGLLMSAGHFLIIYHDLRVLYLALGLIAVGNGFFKPCVISLLGKLYSENDVRREGAYSLFYTGINIGALAGAFVAGWLQIQYGFNWAFAVSSLGMVLGLSGFLYAKRKYLSELAIPVKKGLRKEPKHPLTNVEKKRMQVIFIMAAVQVLYVVAFEQGGGLLTIFLAKHADRIINGWEIPVSWFAALNPLFIIIMAPVLSLFWRLFSSRGKKISFITKFGLGFFASGLSFCVLVVVSKAVNQNPEYMANALAMVVFYLLFTLGELMLFPVFWSAVSSLASPKYASMMMAVALSALGLGSKLAGTVGSFVDTLGFLQIFYCLMGMMFALSVACFLLNKKLCSMLETEEKMSLLPDAALSNDATVKV